VKVCDHQLNAQNFSSDENNGTRSTVLEFRITVMLAVDSMKQNQITVRWRASMKWAN